MSFSVITAADANLDSTLSQISLQLQDPAISLKAKEKIAMSFLNQEFQKHLYETMVLDFKKMQLIKTIRTLAHQYKPIEMTLLKCEFGDVIKKTTQLIKDQLPSSSQSTIAFTSSTNSSSFFNGDLRDEKFLINQEFWQALAIQIQNKIMSFQTNKTSLAYLKALQEKLGTSEEEADPAKKKTLQLIEIYMQQIIEDSFVLT